MTEQELRDFVINNPVGTELPELPVIRGDLNLFGTQIAWLPDNLIVTGSLSVATCRNLRVLPEKLFVGGDLIMCRTLLRMLPADLNVRGNIDASNLYLDIPAGFTTNGDLCLRGYTDKYFAQKVPLLLPDDLTVNGMLDIRFRDVVRWPKNLTVKGRLVTDGTELNRIGGVIISGLDN